MMLSHAERLKMMRHKVRGCLMGAAIGDAMGMPVEGLTPKELKERGLVVSGFLPPSGREIFGTFGLEAGGTTDDWQLTKAVARSLIRTKGKFDISDCAQEHVDELARATIGWGTTTCRAIEDIRDKKREFLLDPLPPAEPGSGSGNGVMMKIAPIAIVNALGIDHRDAWSEAFTGNCEMLGKLTHPDPRAWITAYMIALFIKESIEYNVVWSVRGKELLDTAAAHAKWHEREQRPIDGLVSERLGLIAPAVHDPVDLRNIKGFKRFHCMYTLTITLGTFLRHTNNFRAGVLEVVNHGGDADSNASIVGALIGANVGLEGIPQEWRDFRPEFAEAIELADQLCDLAG